MAEDVSRTSCLQERSSTQQAAEALIDRAASLLDGDVMTPPGVPLVTRVRDVSDAVQAAVDGATQPSRHVLDLAKLAIELRTVEERLREETLLRRIDGLSAVQAALAELRTAGSVQSTLEGAPFVLCERCGFDRVSLLQVRGSELLPTSAYCRDDPGFLAWIERMVAENGAVRLRHNLLETEMVRRRMPVLVRDARNESRKAPWIGIGGPTSYVAAPVMPEGRVIGVFHADVHLAGREADETDRDILWAFAEGYGYALERTILLERLRAQRDHVRELMKETDAVLTKLTDAELQLAKAATAEDAAVSDAALLGEVDVRLTSLLTPREVDVLRLMAEGATNRQIASQLVLAESTVKTHVLGVLRKLRAANRSEAVVRYLSMKA